MAVFKSKEKTKDGRQWVFKARKKDFEGNVKVYYSKKFLTKREAEEAEALFLLKRDNPSKKNFSIVAMDYLEYCKKNRKESTYDTILRDYKKHIEPYFSKYDINDLDVFKLKEWKEIIEKKNYSYNFSNKLYSTLSSLLDYAVMYHGLSENKLKKINRFERKNDKIIDNKTKLKYITIEQFNKFIEYVPEDWKAFFITAFYTGCRKGELTALQFCDLDFENKTININKTLYSKIKDKTGDKVVVNSTKNNQNRTIQMSSYLYDVLLEHKQKAMKFIDYKDSWYVFGNSLYITNTTMDRIKDKAFEDSGVPRITMHEFRHSHVSMLINSYIKKSKEKNMKVDTSKFFLMMSNRMGHTIEVMISTYMHLFPSIQDEIVELLDEL